MSDFGLMVHQCWPDMMRQARRLTMNEDTAEDLVSETTIRALRNEARFQVGTNLKAWLLTILRNQFLSGARRKKWDGGSVDQMLDSALPSVTAPQGAVIDLADAVKALDLLPGDQRAAMLLVGAGASYEEAAEELGISIGTVKSRVYRGRAALVEALA